MKFVIAVLLVALVVEVNSIGAEARNIEVSDSIDSQNFRRKRSVGASQDVKNEWELKTKSGGSLHVSKSVSYNDGGILQMLPTLLDARAKKGVKILNQLQNGKGRPEVAQQMLSADTSVGDLGTDFESRHAKASASSDVSDRIFFPRRTTTTTRSAPVVSNPTIVVHPVAVQPIAVQPIVVRPVAGTGVCCSQSKIVVPVQSAPSHLERRVQKSIDYLRYKQEKKQAYLSKLRGLRELIDYKKEARAQKIRENWAAVHAIKAAEYNKCQTWGCH